MPTCRVGAVGVGLRCSLQALPLSRLLAMLLSVPACMAAAVGPVVAQDHKPPQFENVEVGPANKYRLGFWTPVTLTFRGGDRRATGIVELTANDGDGVPVKYRSSPLLLLPGSPVSTTVYVRLGSNSELGIVLRDDQAEVLFRGKLESVNYDGGPFLPGPLNSHDRLILSVGPNPSLREVRFSNRSGDQRPPVVVPYDDPSGLPTRQIGYDAVDCVVIRADQVSRYGKLPPDASQWRALRNWVEQGGKLVIVAGPDVERLLAAGGPLAALFPVVAEGMATLPRTTALENAVGNRRLDLDVETLAQLRVLRVRETDGEVELAEGDLPLVVRRAVGLGRVTLATIDLENAALKDWSPRRDLVRKLIENAGLTDKSEESTTASSYYGYNDLAGQLRSAVDRYQDVQVISFFTLAMLVLAYIALVGPGDYLLVRKLLRRTELTWITLPLIVLLTTVGAHYLAVGMKGSELRTNQVDVVDCDARSGVVRGVSYAGVFSPSTTRYDVAWRPSDKLFGAPPQDPTVVTTWLGLPGTGLGGMNARSGGGDWFANPYASADDMSSLKEMPIQVWSSKVVTGRWTARAPGSLHAPLVRDGERLSGELRNPFGAALVGAWLFHDDDAYKIDDLGPGKSVNLKGLYSQGLRNVLTDTRVLESQKKHQTSRSAARPYDYGSFEVGGIVRQMMFFEAAGGQSRANLENRYQAFLDAGELLALNRAILVALVEKPEEFGSELSLESDGVKAPRNHDSRYMVVRLVIPVESAAP